MAQRFPGHGFPFLDSKSRFFLRVQEDADDHFIEKGGSPFSDINMTVGYRVKRARIDCS